MPKDGGPVSFINIFQSPPEPGGSTTFDLDKLTEEFGKSRNSDWSVPEAFLCLMLSAAMADGHLASEEREAVVALTHRSRALKTLSPSQLADTNTVVERRLRERPNALQEACEALPSDMRLPLFAHCVDIVLADGSFQAVEADFLNKIVNFLGVEIADAKRIIEALLVKNRF